MKLIFFIVVLFIYINPVFAYIDPGTGSILVSVIIGLAMTALFSLRGVLYWFLGVIGGKAYKSNNDFTGKLVFYNEGGKYWPVFMGVLQYLRDRGISYVYLSSDQDDEGLRVVSDHQTSCYIGSMRASIVFLNSLKASVCVMTTPQLNVINLKKSAGVNHYCHIMHAPADIHTYKKFAFDHFDSVLCTSEFQIRNIRQLEKDRFGKEKVLFRTGCTLFDSIDTQAATDDFKDAILIAPTWGDKSSLLPYAERLIENLIKAKKKVIFRPHPQSFISEQPIINAIRRRYEESNLFRFDDRCSNIWALSNSCVLVCDISGMVFDFVFIRRLAVVVFDTDACVAGYESFDLASPNALYGFIRETGCALITKDKDSSVEEVLRLMGKPIEDASLKDYIFNYGKASAVAAEQILALINQAG